MEDETILESVYHISSMDMPLRTSKPPSEVMRHRKNRSVPFPYVPFDLQMRSTTHARYHNARMEASKVKAQILYMVVYP